MDTPSIHIIILNWNSFDETVECLESLRGLSYPNYKIQLVDNASLNDEADRLKERFPEIHLLKQSENTGFCGGCNVGMEAALQEGADFVMLLNNDTLVTRALIEDLISGYRKLERPGAISPLILKYPETDKIWFSRASWETNWHTGEARFRLTDTEDAASFDETEPYESEFACGCCLFVPCDVIKEVGLFDERYFAFFDEAEWCARMHRTGRSSYVVPTARIFHKVGRTTPNLVMTYLLTRNRLLWISENLGTQKKLNAYRVMLKELGWNLLNASHMISERKRYISPSRSRVFLLGWKDYILGRFGKWNERTAKVLFAQIDETASPALVLKTPGPGQIGMESIHSDTSIQDEQYLRKRLKPEYGDAEYIHLSDLLKGLKEFAIDESISILDYGCGGSPYRSLFPNSDYKRADFGEMKDLDYVIGNDSRVEERDGVFDLILSTQVAEHVSNPKLYFAECYRLLKSGGKMICTTHGTYPDHGCPYDFQRWTADGLARDLRTAGFEIERSLKLTTNARAMMYLAQRFSGWFESPSGLSAGVFRVMRSVMHRRPKFWQKLADRAFASNAIMETSTEGHEFYIGLMICARKA